MPPLGVGHELEASPPLVVGDGLEASPPGGRDGLEPSPLPGALLGVAGVEDVGVGGGMNVSPLHRPMPFLMSSLQTKL